MVTKLKGNLRREVSIDGVAYVASLSAEGLKLVRKGHRKGLELAWKDLVSGEAALAAALNASVRAASEPRRARTVPGARRRSGTSRTPR